MLSHLLSHAMSHLLSHQLSLVLSHYYIVTLGVNEEGEESEEDYFEFVPRPRSWATSEAIPSSVSEPKPSVTSEESSWKTKSVLRRNFSAIAGAHRDKYSFNRRNYP